jgi:hypothetical protein
VSESSRFKPYYDRPIITDRTTHNNIPHVVVFDNTIKEAYLIDVAIPYSDNFHSTITEKRHKYTGWKEDVIRIWQLKMACIKTLVLSTTGIVTNKLHESLTLLNLRPALYVTTRKAVILNTCRIVGYFLAVQ